MRKKIAGLLLAGAIALSGCEQMGGNITKTEDLDNELCKVIYGALWDLHKNIEAVINAYGYDEYEYQYDINYRNYHENKCTKYNLGELPLKYEGDQLMKIMGNCGSCIHWHEEKQRVGGVIDVQGKRVGACKRYPPVIVPQLKTFLSPRTGAAEVCGEYTAEVGLNGR